MENINFISHADYGMHLAFMVVGTTIPSVIQTTLEAVSIPVISDPIESYPMTHLNSLFFINSSFYSRRVKVQESQWVMSGVIQHRPG